MTRYNNPLIQVPLKKLPKRVGVLGAGTIGPDIGYYLKSALPNLQLVLIDIDIDALKNAKHRIDRYISKGLDLGKFSEDLAKTILQDWIITDDYKELVDCEIVIEAVTENLDLKRKIFSQVEEIIPHDALITSNTSSIPAAKLFSHLQNPRRATVTHFFAPAWRNPVVEIVEWEQSSFEVVEWLRWLFCFTGKVPLVTSDVVCFMLDRVFDNWCNEAALLLDQATPSEIDSVAQEFVFAGPFFVLNMANGNPIIVAANNLQAIEEGDHYLPAAELKRFEPWNTVSPGGQIPVDQQLASIVRKRLLGVLFSQSADILNRKLGSPDDLDLGCRLALGFRQGPLELMSQLGASKVEEILTSFAAERSGMPAPLAAITKCENLSRSILVDEIDDVVVITIRRPEALNALHDGINDEILGAIDTNPQAQGFVITGYGDRAFSAGADIGRFPEVLGDSDAAIEYAEACSKLLNYLDNMQKPVIAAVNGLALGGGLELAIRCHRIVAMENSIFQFPEINLGIVPGIGGMVVPYRRWPGASGTFHKMLRDAEQLNSREALHIGMVDSISTNYQDLITMAVELAKKPDISNCKPSENPVSIESLPSAVGTSATGEKLSMQVLAIMDRAIIECAACKSFSEALARGYRAFGETACSSAASEGIGAFLENSKPDFTKTG